MKVDLKEIFFHIIAAVTILIFGFGIDMLLLTYLPTTYYETLTYTLLWYAMGVIFVKSLERMFKGDK